MPLDISTELAMLELARWEEVEAGDPLWRSTAELLIKRVTIKKGLTKAKPMVEATWSPAAAVIREAIEAAV